jgi:hypothetical protein
VQLETIHAGHRHIDNGNFCLIDLVSIQTLTTARKCQGVVTMRTHEASQCPPHGRFIVNNTDEFLCTSHRQIIAGIAKIEYRTLVLHPGAQQRATVGAVQANVGGDYLEKHLKISSRISPHSSLFIRAAHDKIKTDCPDKKLTRGTVMTILWEIRLNIGLWPLR